MSCSTCSANLHGGCAQPGSPLHFDEAPDPRGTCNHYAPRQAAASSDKRVPLKPEDVDRQRLNEQLAHIENEHSRRVWDSRMVRSEGRRP